MSDPKNAWQVVLDNLGLVRFHANRTSDPSDDRDDAIQDGVIGLFNAARRFDPERGYTLSAAASPWIKGEMRRGATARRGGANARRHSSEQAGTEAPDREPFLTPVSLDHAKDSEDGPRSPLATIADTRPDSDPSEVAGFAWVVEQLVAGCRDDADRAIVAHLAEGNGNYADIGRQIGRSRSFVTARVVRLRQLAQTLLSIDDDYPEAA